jgi:hypothetical protein
MQYGEIQHYQEDEGKQKVTTIKLRHGLPFLDESTYKERVQVIRPSDLDSIIETMHTEHALNETYGAWLEKAKDGRLYVVKYWVERKPINKT